MKLRLSPVLLLACLSVLSWDVLAATRSSARGKSSETAEEDEESPAKTTGSAKSKSAPAGGDATAAAGKKGVSGKSKGAVAEEEDTEGSAARKRSTSKKGGSSDSGGAAEGKPQPASGRKKGAGAEEEPASTPHQKASASEAEAVAKVKKTGRGDVPEATVEAPPKNTPPATPPVPGGTGAPPAYIESSDLKTFKAQPPRVQQLIESALVLAHQGLTYKFGSDDPANGGMDCSGSIAYLLREQGFKDVPRDASSQYIWARKHGEFFAVVSKKAGGFEFSDLQPGDLMFWSGTYAVDKDPPVTHTMIYLGEHTARKQRVMWGSSDGRSYDGKSRFGVGVFDFKMPKATGEGDGTSAAGKGPDFLGYARIPGLREAAETANQHDGKPASAGTDDGPKKTGKEKTEEAADPEGEEAAKAAAKSDDDKPAAKKGSSNRQTRERPRKAKSEE